MDLTIKQTCEELQQSRTTVGYLLRTGRLAGYKIGTQGRSSSWRIPEDAIRAYRERSR